MPNSGVQSCVPAPYFYIGLNFKAEFIIDIKAVLDVLVFGLIVNKKTTQNTFIYLYRFYSDSLQLIFKTNS